jgi:hypothetical protein
MKALGVVFLWAALCGILVAQSEPTLEMTIRRSVLGGSVEGQGIKQIERAGDEAAIVLRNVLANRRLTNEQIETAIYVLDSAFLDSDRIEEASAREPRTAVEVLRYLEARTSDAALKAKIAETRKRLNVAAAKVVKPGR